LSGYLALADGRTVPVRDGLVIGRVPGCDLVVDDHKASRRHARVVVESGVVEIEDLGSSNGTLLNGKPVTRRVLRPGDEVQIGKMVLVYREGAPASAPAQPGAQPGTPAPRPAAATSFADDDDLFGSTNVTPAAAPPVPSPAPPPPRPVPAPAAAPRPLPPPPPVAPAPPPPPPRPAVVEFADEVVEVRKPTAAPAAAKSPAGAAAEPAIRTQQRVLQYSTQAGGGGVLGDDLGQISGGTRSLIFAAVLAGAGGIAWLVMRVVG